jgi:predicted metal-dependent phosphoesterase TrpH
MNKADIDAILDRVRTWPEERQEDAARILLVMEHQNSGVYRLSDEERTEIRAALAEVERGEVASDAEVAAVFNRYRNG